MLVKVKGFDGRSHNLDLRNSEPIGETRPRSSHHLEARKLLAQLFPADKRLEEIYLPGSGGLYVDFFLPNRAIMVEVHGEQHYKFNSFFHKTRLDFFKQLERDGKKEEWCELNNFTLIILPHWESVDEWTSRIRGAA